MCACVVRALCVCVVCVPVDQVLFETNKLHFHYPAFSSSYFLGVLASICSTYGNIFFLISKVHVFIQKKIKEISVPEKCQSLP